MYRLTVVYDHPADPEKFLQHYREVHVPLTAKVPNMLAFEWGPSETADGSKPDHFLIAVLDWETKEDAFAALATDAGRASAADVANFAKAGEYHMSFSEVRKAV